MPPRLLLNPASLNLVRPELARLIRQAQTEFDSAVQQDPGAHDLGPCREMLAQADGVLRMIELGDAALLTRELGELLKALPLDNPRAMEAITRAFFVLARYLDYLGGRRQAAPELLLEHINALRGLLGRDALGEASFSQLVILPDRHCPPPAAGGEEVTDALLRRLRHHYQVGLIGVIKGRSDPVHLRLMQRAAERMCRLSGGGAAADFWWLLTGVLEGMVLGQLRSNPARARLLSRADRQFRDFLQKPDTRASARLGDDLRGELLYLVAKCRDGKRIREIQSLCEVVDAAPPDQQLVEERKLLMGTSVDSIDSMVRLLKGDMHRIKDELEQAASATEPRPATLAGVHETLERVAAALREGGLRSSADTLDKQLQKIGAALGGGTELQRQDLVSIADAVVYVETTLSGLARAQGMARGLRAQQQGASGPGVAREALDEARHTLLQSAREAVESVKRDVSSYAESNFDAMVLAPSVAQLHAVRGALQILEHPRAAAVAGQTAQSILDSIANGCTLAGGAFAELLADLLICLEYYLAALENAEDPDPLMLKLADESLGTLGRPSRANC
ncbi:MAG: hypothetical protein KA739_13420 [Pseudomonadales bacterium]|nr:hypothetical protein [Gammaproteobacteria bacterium]MBP6052839.1 hypothetical protein [Pseudomonadales bacterium]MBK6582344.1 hypothetical protein [Gammaproteobacteria bacterium]MBK7521384.1 hypothetical protein [Gammaproteobacteria bacterium]MBK9668021.1 hypothetical protein [Gammaproteobacteria bacterium]